MNFVKGKPDRLITSLYCWVSVDPETKLEGIIAFRAGQNNMQCVSSNFDLMKEMRGQIRLEVAQAGYKAKLIKFSNSEVMEVV